MKKVLHVTYDMRIGGTEQVIKNIISANNDPNLMMGIICIESPLGPFASELMANGITFYQLNRKPGFDLALITQIRQIIRTNHIDILHCHQYTPWVYGALAAAFTNTQVIFTEHGRFYPDKTSFKRRLINPLLNLLTNKITAISSATKQSLVDYEFLPKHKIKVIYNGIEPLACDQQTIAQLRHQLNISEGDLVLGTIARLDPIKNHQMMLAAFGLALKKYPNLKLVVVGDGEERQRIETTIQTMNLQDKVILTGYITQPNNYLALFDIFLLSSFSEGTSMTLLEAMSLAKPCVVTDVGGNREVIIDNQNGLVTTNDDVTEFCEAIEMLLSNPSRLSTMASNAKKHFLNTFTHCAMFQHYQAIYDNQKEAK